MKLVNTSMTLNLSNLKPPAGSTKKPKRIGRGPGSGTGKTSGKGHKGQKARSGYSRNLGREGGQMPLHRRLPKRGFHNIFRVEYQPVNLGRLAEMTDAERIDVDLMVQKRIIRHKRKPVKVLGVGEIGRSVTIVADAASASAIEKIKSAGGTFEVAKTC